MSLRLPTVMALLAPLLAVAQAPALQGRWDGATYHSAQGGFSITSPVLPELGGRVADTANVVTFDDAFSVHIGIASFPLDLTQKWELETRGARDYLAFFFSNFVLPDFATRVPETTVESMRWVAGLQGGALAVFALMPGGSFFQDRNAIIEGAAAGVPAAKRGTLLFVRNGRVFVVTTELAERVTQSRTFRKTPEEENDLLQQRLAEIVGRMTFADPGAGRSAGSR